MKKIVKKRVIASYFTDEALNKAKEKIDQLNVTNSFVFGEIDENDIPLLKKQKGIILDILEDDQVIETSGRSTLLDRDLQFEAPMNVIDQNQPNFYILELKGPLLKEWRNQIDKNGVKLLTSIPYNNFTAKLTPEQATIVKDLPFVKNIRLYDEVDTNRVAFDKAADLPTSASAPGIELKMITYEILLHEKDDLQKILNWLNSNHVNVASANENKIRFYLIENSPLLREIRRLPEIAILQEFTPIVPDNEVSRLLMGIDLSNNSNTSTGSDIVSNISQAGDGQIIAIADTGIYDAHPDFVGTSSWGRRNTNDHSDPNGHGTHVTGSVLGDGSASGGKIRGTAPKAKLFFQSLLDHNGEFYLPSNLVNLFDEAYQSGARVYSNSWGEFERERPSIYRIVSFEVDDYVFKHPDILIVRSAGNYGIAMDPTNTPKGYVDWLSINSPGSCKNGLTVGAARTSRTDGPSKDRVWGLWRDRQTGRLRFPDPPLSTDKVCGDPECMAAFSSRGPTDDYRIKPDVVAPGTDILSTKSDIAPNGNFWGLYPENDKYAYMGGTSMATPLVAGCAALVREYYIKDRNHEPSAALLKATLINSTKMLNGEDSTAQHNKLPNYHQGFGFVYMTQTIPNKMNQNFKLEFVDSWKDPDKKFDDLGQRFHYELSCSSNGSFLRICMAYNDLPGRGLQNNLNLSLMHRESGQLWQGNQDRLSHIKIRDPDNNVEIIR